MITIKKGLQKFAVITTISAVASGLTFVPNIGQTESVFAATAQTKTPNLVYLSTKSSVKLMSADVVPNEDKEQFVFRLRVYNNEVKSLDLLNYWFRLKDKKGKSYTAKQVQPEQSKPVASGSYQDLVFVADVGQKRKVDEFNIVCVKWDFSVANYERTIGTILIPSGYTKVVSSNAAASFPLGTTTLKAQIKSSQRYVEDEDEKYQIIIDLTNTGKWGATLGQETLYYVRTQAGYIYPLTPKDNSLSLLPQQKKSIELNGEIPTSVDLANAVLMIGIKESKMNAFLPYLTYKLPVPGQGTGPTTDDTGSVEFDKSVTFKYGEQNISIKGENLYRYPDQSQDWLAATFRVSNPSKLDLKTPNLEASLALNGVSVSTKAIIVTDENNLIKASSNWLVTVLVPLSYKEKYSTITIELKSKTDTATQTIAKYKTAVPQNSVINKKFLKQAWNTYDNSSQLTVQKAINYEGAKTDLISVELDYKNLEGRLGNVKALKAYLINQAGSIYPTEIIKPTKTELSPNGTGQILVQTRIPKNVGTSDFKLVIGEEYISGDQKAIFNPVSVDLLTTRADTSDLLDLEIGTDVLSIRHVLAAVYDDKSFRMYFDYDYNEGPASYDWSSGERNIILELIDENGATFEKKISLTTETGDYLVLGKNKSASIAFEDSQLFNKVPTFKAYKLNVYEELDGHKRLIGSKLLEWMSRSSD